MLHGELPQSTADGSSGRVRGPFYHVSDVDRARATERQQSAARTTAEIEQAVAAERAEIAFDIQENPHNVWTADLRVQLDAAEARLATLQAERDDFYQQYRQSCDTETKAQAVEIEHLRTQVATLEATCQQQADQIVGEREWRLASDEVSAYQKQRAAAAEAAVQTLRSALAEVAEQYRAKRWLSPVTADEANRIHALIADQLAALASVSNSEEP